MQLVLPTHKKHHSKTNKLILPQSHNHPRFQLIVFQPVPQLAALFPVVRAGALGHSLCVSSPPSGYTGVPEEETSRTFLALCLPAVLSLAALMEEPVAQPSGMTLLSRQEMGKSENIFSLLSQGSSCALTFPSVAHSDVKLWLLKRKKYLEEPVVYWNVCNDFGWGN